jgi:uncharacterized membrane protein YfcA
MEEIIGYSLAVLVGVSLGLIGSGGSILTVPILVYIMNVEPTNATAYSLFIVGATALVGGIKNAMEKNVDFKTVLIFGAPSIVAVYLTRAYLVPFIPKEMVSLGDFIVTKDIFLMMLFAIVMILASYSMIKPSKKTEENTGEIQYNVPMIFIEGTLVGILTGLVGAGGGFLIIPALVILARIPMKLAVGTSLLIIAAKSLIGFYGDIKTNPNLDFHLITYFTVASIMGMFIGIYLTKKIDGAKLKTGFGWFVLIMGVYIIVKELFLK